MDEQILDNPTPMMEYNRHVIAWRRMSMEYSESVDAAARSEVQWKAARSRAIVRAKHSDPKMSAVLAEAIADGDPEVEKLALERFVNAAKVEGGKKQLEWARAYADNLRTQVVNGRMENSFSSGVGAGPGQMVEAASGEVFGSGRPPRQQISPPQQRRGDLY